MPATITFRRTGGWEKLTQRLNRFATDFATDFAENDTKQIARNHLAFAKALCPVGETGELQESLHLTMDMAVLQASLATDIVEGTKVRGSGFVSGDKSAQGGLSIGSQKLTTAMTTFGKFIRARYYVTSLHPAARFVEYGTQFMAAQPFMRPAYDFAKALYRIRLRRFVIARARGDYS